MAAIAVVVAGAAIFAAIVAISAKVNKLGKQRLTKPADRNDPLPL